MENNYYVYIYTRLDNNTIFYVGKGKGNRFKDMRYRNDHFLNIVNSIPYEIKFLYTDLSDQQALELEKQTIYDLVFTEGYGIDINDYRKPNEIKHLCNQTFGGEGTSGYKWTEEQREKNKEYWTDERKQEMSEKMSGEGNPCYNKHCTDFMTEEQIEKWRENISKTLSGRKFTEEHINKISGSNNHNATKVIALIDNKIFACFDCIQQAMKFFNIKSNHIGEVCKGDRKSLGKYNGHKIVWRYLNSIEL